jgi:hypothetical protein
MKAIALVITLAATAALADDIGDGDDCWDLGAGASCFTHNGTPGTCERQSTEWIDAQGVKHRQVNMVCVATATAQQRVQLSWLAAGVAFLAACLGWAWRPQTRTKALKPRAA